MLASLAASILDFKSIYRGGRSGKLSLNPGGSPPSASKGLSGLETPLKLPCLLIASTVVSYSLPKIEVLIFLTKPET